MEHVFFLAIIDREDNVRLRWPAPGDAHADLAEKLASRAHPGRFARRRRRKLADAIRAHILELQNETVTLAP